MAEGNEVDLGHIAGMVGTVLTELRDVREDVHTLRVNVRGLPADIREVRATLADHGRTLAEHSRALADLRFGLTELRSTVANDHASVPGRGILTSEPQARIARVERHLELPPAA